jgi:uncharacterized membrane protein
MKKFVLFILGCLIIISGMILAIINWSNFPESIAVHFYANGAPNGFAGKTTALILIPVFLLFTHIFLFVCLIKEKQKEKIPIVFELLFTLLIPIISVIYDLAIFSSVYNIKLDIFLVVYGFVSIVFMICGNYIPKIEKSIPLVSRILGWVFLLSGSLMLLFTLLKLKIIVITITIVSVITIVVIAILHEKKRS